MNQSLSRNSIDTAPASVTLTEAQSGLWYAQRLDPGNPIFNTAHAIEIHGALDVPAFERAVNAAVAESDALALCMVDTPSGPRQYVDEARRPWLERIDLSDQADSAETAREAMLRDLHTPIDPTRDPLAAEKLYALGAQQFVWYQRVHHLAIDGFGMILLTNRIAELYAVEIGALAAAGPAFPSWQVAHAEDQAYRSSPRRAVDIEYWRQTFATPPEVVGMSPGRAVSAHRFHRTVLSLPPSLTVRLRKLAEQAAVPWPDVLTTLVATYCQRMSGTPEIIVGVPHMGRLGSAAARVPAMLMNVLPVRIAPDESVPLPEFLVGVSKTLARARRHGRYRSEQLRRDLGLLGGARRLYGPMINVLPFDQPPTLAGVDVNLEVLGTGPIDDITFTFRGDAIASLTLEVDSNPELYSPEATLGHARRLQSFLDAALAKGALADIPIASPEEVHRYVHAVNATAHSILAPATLTSLIEASMQRTPDAAAVVFGNRTLTYRDLDTRTAALAAQLAERGIGPEDIVAVALPRSLELVIALVAILRAGAAYLPLDLAHPRERIRRIVTAARARCVLAANKDSHLFEDLAPVVTSDSWSTSTDSWHAVALSPRNAAYVIYTSGSTGEPKGVLIEHEAIVNRLEWMREHYDFTARDRILQKTPATFDVSVWEFFLPLTSGATLVVAPPDAHRDPQALAAIIREQRITTLHFVPSMLAAFLDEPTIAGLKIAHVFCSGEALPAELRDRFHTLIDAQLHNLYGPTEAAVDVSFWPASAQDRSAPVPIGFPVWNTRLYVLDDGLRPVPAGVAGHLFIAGVQLARGYLGRADLTNERFIPDPFVAGERMYRTGDLARWRREGAVVFLGRSDDQIKLRGLRIELGEIETAIASSGFARHVGVITREDRGGSRKLVAYLVPAEGYDEEALRKQLARRLPDYMLPAAFVTLDSLPVNRNGKLDRAALPAPDFRDTQRRPPQTDTERGLVALFAEVLGLAELPGVDADFFTLGGDSLLAVHLMLRIQQRWGHDPGLGALFAHPSVSALATFIDSGTLLVDHGLSPLIKLAAGDASLPPLFLIHPAGGIAWCYRDLARSLSPRRTVYGLQAPALDPHVAVPASIDALAADYTQRIQAVRPHGPYHLAGWSVGGIIAQAMAAHLHAAGSEVGLLALFDSYPSECWRAEPEPDEIAALRSLLSIAGHDPAQHPELITRESIVDFLRRSGSSLGSLPPVVMDGVIRVVTDTNRLVRQHYHARYDGTLTHVRAALDHTGRNLKPQQWAPYAAQLDLIDVPFLHPQLTGAEASVQIARALEPRLANMDKRHTC